MGIEMPPLRLAALWVLMLVVAVCLAVYGSQVDEASWEVTALHRLQGWTPGVLNDLAEFLTLIGKSPYSRAIAIVSIGLVYLSGRHKLALVLALAASLRVLSVIVKAIVGRERPADPLVDVSSVLGSPSFPSGHVLGATLLYGSLIYAAEVCIAHAGLRRLVQGCLLSIVLLMGFARMELGEHWPTDVAGGYLIGALVLMVVVWVHRQIEPPVVEQERVP